MDGRYSGLSFLQRCYRYEGCQATEALDLRSKAAQDGADAGPFVTRQLTPDLAKIMCLVRGLPLVLVPQNRWSRDPFLIRA